MNRLVYILLVIAAAPARGVEGVFLPHDPFLKSAPRTNQLPPRPLPTPKQIQTTPAPRITAPAPPPPRTSVPPKTEVKPSARPTPAALTPAPTPPPPPPPPPKKTRAECSGATADIREMINETINTNIFNVTWFEDHPLVGRNAKFRIFDDAGVAQIEMINAKGKSVGISPARVCVITERGTKALRVSLQTSRLRFGSYFVVDLDDQMRELLRANTGQTNELPLIVSAGPAPGLIHIRDGFDGGSKINSSFSPTSAR